MKLEVGMYVRTKNYNHIPSYINKIIKTTDDYVKLENQKDTHYSWEKEDILKARYNPIDLIEVGDYVNGQIVVEIIPENRKVEPSTMIYTGTNYYVGLYNEDIETVVTREQFESMSYKVGE